MECPKCGGYLDKVEISDWCPEGDHRITIIWKTWCPYCEYDEAIVEEEFESTGWEKIVEE